MIQTTTHVYKGIRYTNLHRDGETFASVKHARTGGGATLYGPDSKLVSRHTSAADALAAGRRLAGLDLYTDAERLAAASERMGR